MLDLTRESILEAIQQIDTNPELKKGRESIQYDLLHERKKYPPILVISEANKLVGGSEVTIRDFGNSTKRAFKVLEKQGFRVIPKEASTPNFWFVYQGGTYSEKQGKKYLWAPTKNKAGRRQFYWDNMRDVKKGDIIFNYSKGIRAVSIAVSDCYEAPNPFNESNWELEGYKVDIQCFELERTITLDELRAYISDFGRILNGVEKRPFNRNWGANQGYLYEFTKEASKIIRDIYGKPFENKMIEEVIGNVTIEDQVMSPFKPLSQEKINMLKFKEDLPNTNLIFDSTILSRLISSLLTKPFVILTGLSGSGKTKLAQAFTQWISSDKSQYCIVPVGADWTNREPLLGYPNALSSEEYIKPDNGVLDLLIRANDNPDLPYFLILDEMNLSHVERYFADFLSVMESNELISLYSGNQRQSSDGTEIPTSIGVPPNLFLIGTVNIDETTYMFSPKVLDRANVIEFRVSSDEITSFLENPQSVDLSQLEGHGAAMGQSFLELAQNKKFENPDLKVINATLTDFFNELKKLGAEFGYRSANEIVRLINQLSVIDAEMEIDQKIDIAIMQKLLPKLHGSRRKLVPVLIALGGFCIEKGSIEKIETDVFEKVDFDVTLDVVKYPISLEKLIRMYKCGVDNGYASYAEA